MERVFLFCSHPRSRGFCGAADAAGLRPVLDPVRPLTRDDSDRETRPLQGPASKGTNPHLGVPGRGLQTGKKGPKPALTPAHSFRDDLRQADVTGRLQIEPACST